MRFAYSPLSFAILTALSTSIYANDLSQAATSASIDSPIPLTPIVMQAEKTVVLGTIRYTKEDLEKTPNSSKNITDFLKVNPNVQFSNDHLAASTQADLKPAEISIHGAQSFQNKFIINGVSNTNILDPQGNGNSYTGQLASGSQGVAINTDLLCNLDVLDSNVSAKYGSFTGGVISADTCAPDTEIGKIHGSISYDYTESDWSRYHLKTDADKDLFEDETTQANQNEYTRQGISANMYSKLSEQWGINLYGSERRSVIPVASGFDTPAHIEQKKHNSNIGATAFYTPNDEMKGKFGFTLGDLEDNNYTASRRNSKNTVTNDSLMIFGELNQQTDWAKLKHKLNYQKIDNVRDWLDDEGKVWLYAEGSKDWQDTDKVKEGSLGTDIRLKQESFNYEFDAIFNHFKWGQSVHQISAGAGYQRDDVSWSRPNTASLYVATTHSTNPNLVTLKNLNGEKCAAGDRLCDEAVTAPFTYKDQEYTYNGQYYVSGTLHEAGTFDGIYEQSFLYVEDEINWNKFKARLGVRADYDGANNNLNFAPRSSFSYKPFTNDALTLTTGWNRYYSAPTYNTDLQREIAGLSYTIKRADQNSEWVKSPNVTYNSTRKTDLDMPYADEFILGLNSQFKNTNVILKWVNREYKDEITRNRTDIPLDSTYKYSYEYGNDGYGSADTYALSINMVNPLNFKGSWHQFGLALDYNKRVRGTPDYTENTIDTDMTKLVSYDGKIMQYADRPASNFNQPFAARLNWDIGFNALPLKIYHFFSYKNEYNQAISSTNKVEYEGVKLDTYVVEKIKPRFSWDMRTTYDWKIGKDYDAIFGLNINNLTNRNNQFVYNSKLYSEIGRRFIADITFKF
ncbi:TonB-dependent receptor plug domain-containing protein [Acinetobacter sp.]|uniref:TonB-dependent receptor plug domain-containing protein n=1 Tax=Acinetobacter sp. TaxID=472 RepID=UPI003C74000B